MSIAKDELIQLRISAELKELIKKKADEENRTMSNYIITAIKEKIEKEKKKAL